MKKYSPAINREIGSRIHILRLKNKLSQSELGSKLGVTFQQIQKYEKGTNTLSASRMKLMCEVLHCTPSDLVLPNAEEHRVLAQLSDRTIRIALRIEKLDHKQTTALNKLIDVFEGMVEE